MDITFDITLSSRNNLLAVLDTHSLEQLNEIPSGFSNNLIWNVAHVIVVQQMLLYHLSGLPMVIPDELVSRYKRGTRPEKDCTVEELAQIREFLFSTLEHTKNDFMDGVFENYNAFTTTSGFTVKNVDDAARFNIFHEGVHMGIILQLKKRV